MRGGTGFLPHPFGSLNAFIYASLVPRTRYGREPKFLPRVCRQVPGSLRMSTVYAVIPHPIPTSAHSGCERANFWVVFWSQGDVGCVCGTQAAVFCWALGGAPELNGASGQGRWESRMSGQWELCLQHREASPWRTSRVSHPATPPGRDGSESTRATTRKKWGGTPVPWDTGCGITELAASRGAVFQAQQGAFTKPWGITEGWLSPPP